MFNQEYCEMLCELNIPILFVDAPVGSYSNPLAGDVLLMDNTTGIFSLIKEMKNRGVKEIGFIGESNHCRSFFERYVKNLSIQHAPADNKITVVRTETAESVAASGRDKELFICANDFVAIDLVNCLKILKHSYPEDVMICGFDDSAESKVMTPALTTCHIHSQIMGFTAANLLVSRIEQPDLNYRTVYTEANLILRGSTKD